MTMPFEATNGDNIEQQRIEDEDTLEVSLDSKNPSQEQICKVERFYMPPPDPVDDVFAGILPHRSSA